MSFVRRLQQSWYADSAYPLLKPFSKLFSLLVKLRRFAYRQGYLKSHRLPVPVIVVGNISVGGTGKTPLVIWLTEYLKEQGFKPGVISRGYGGKKISKPVAIGALSDAMEVGDEPLLIYQRTGCPVVVFPKRAEAGKFLLQQFDCDVLICDDGLQHYALQRDIEIAVIDGKRRFGNGLSLPAGPLREPVERLQSVDRVLCQGEAGPGEYGFFLEGSVALNLKDEKSSKSLSEFKGLKLNAVAGIGNLDRFFKHLSSFGLDLNERSFPDHHRFEAHEINFDDGLPVLMTEKDAVKCRAFALQNHWYLPVNARLPVDFGTDLLKLLKEKYDGQKTA